MAVSYSTASVHGLFNATALKEQFANFVIDIYSGTRPTNADSAVGAGTMLGRVTLNGGAFTEGVSTNGLNLDTPAARAVAKPSAAVWQFTGLANGTATWFRVRANAADDGTARTDLYRIDGSIGLYNAEMIVDKQSIVLNNVYTINSFNIPFATA